MREIRKRIRLLCLIGGLLLLTGCTSIQDKIVEQIQETPPYIEVTAEEETFADKFYYKQLSDSEKQSYREIYEGLLMQEKEICLHWIEAEDVNRILDYVIYDFAEIFWTDGAATSTTYDESVLSKGYTILEINYIYSKEETEERRELIADATKVILAGVPEEYGEYEKIKYIYEYLVNNVDYVEDAPDNQNIYSVFINKQTVCAGYAKATQYLLNELGIYCTYVTGKAVMEGKTEAHAWNIVRCNGKFYYVDVTWADPLFQEGQKVVVDIVYDYLCCSEDALKKTHTLDEGYTYPVCDANDLDYYQLNGMYYSKVDKKQLLQVMKQSINRKESKTVFKFAEQGLYEEGKQLLLNELMNKAAEYLCDRYGLRQVEYLYVEYDNTNRFVVYWQYHS